MTRWSVVLSAGQEAHGESSKALEELCRTYWLPIYTFVRRHSRSPEEAQDLVQGFFAEFLTRRAFQRAAPDRGRFRTFLIRSVQNYLSNRREWASAQKRGSGLAPLSLDKLDPEEHYQKQLEDGRTPDRAWDKEWCRALLRAVFSQLRAEYMAAGKERFYDELQPHLWGDAEAMPYAALGERLGMSLTSVKVGAHRLKLRFREVLRGEIAQTVRTEAEVDGEIRYLMGVMTE